jgi:hypothetical protein
VGKTLASGTSLGVAYYAQWKMTADSGTDLSRFVAALEKHRVFAVGPELCFLQGGVVRRGLFEFDARNQFDGFVILANLAAPF